MRFCYSVDALERKPTNPIKYQRKENYRTEDLTIKEIARLCGSGHCWRAGIYPSGIGTFKKKEVESAQVIALDFDSAKRGPFDAVEYAASIGVPPNFWYPSFSQNPDDFEREKERKSPAGTLLLIKDIISNGGETGDFAFKNGWNYRLVWCLEREISPAEYETAYRSLQDAFADFEPDKSTKDCSRLWYGGRLGAALVTDEPLELKALGALAVYQKTAQGIEPRKAVKQKKGFIPDYADMEAPESVAVGEGWGERLRGRCPLWDKWTAGSYLNYNERLALFSNLKFLRYNTNSKSIVADVLSYYNPETYAGHTCDEEQVRARFRDTVLKPLPIVRGAMGEPMTVADFFRETPAAAITPDVPKVSLEELDAWMDTNVPAFLNDREPKLKVLKSQTGSGKTKRIIDYILWCCNLEKRKVIYAAPKHSNLLEVEGRLKQKATLSQVEHIFRLPEKDYSAADVLYLSLGLPAKTRSAKHGGFIHKLFDKECKGVFLITHSLLTCLNGLDADLIIVDEEIDTSLVKETRLELPALATVLPFLDSTTAAKLFAFIENVKYQTREQGLDIDLSLLRNDVAPQLKDRIDDYIQGTSSNLAVGFFECMNLDGRLSKAGGMNCIRMVRKSPLIEDSLKNATPIRVFSATPISKRTEMYYKTEVDVLEAPLAENKGRIIQFCGLSGARGRDNGNLPKLASYVKERLPKEVIENSPLITFMASEKEEGFWAEQGFNLARNDGKQIHLMNNSGLDCFKGKSTIVIGKLDLPQQHYQDVYDEMYADAKGNKELVRQNQRIHLNGVWQRLYLFVDEDIRTLQLEYIQAATEQAAGRARALREEGATVYLFSDLAIKDADEVRP